MGRKTQDDSQEQNKRDRAVRNSLVTQSEPTVIIDQREQRPWSFNSSRSGLLKTGDYSLEGYEDVFTIERKGNSGELAGNLFDDRFYRELDRMEKITFPFLICEFDMDDIVNFPANSGIPHYLWPKLQMTPKLYLKKLMEIQLKYKCKILFCGPNGKLVAESIFKRILEQ